ncbi:MAG: DUF6443 domain-containing protein, partial [Bacteroidota bacterium]
MSIRALLERLALLLVVLAALAIPAGAQSVTTTTTYEYDPTTLLLKAETVESSDGAYRRTETEYAYEVQRTEMRNLNMLAQVHRTLVYGRDSALSDTLVACARVDYSGESIGGQTHYFAQDWADGCGGDEVFTGTADLPDAFDAHGRMVRTRNSNGLTTEAYYSEDPGDPFCRQGSNACAGPRLTGLRRHGYGIGGANSGDDFDSLALEESFEYDSAGRLVALSDPNGNRITYDFDGLGRLVGTRNDAGELVTEHEYAFSAAESVSGDYDPDRPNRVSTILHGSVGQGTTTWFDGLGREVATTQYESSYYDNVTLTEYDDAGRLFRTWRPTRIHAGGYRSSANHSNWRGGVVKTPGDFAPLSSSYWDRYEISGLDAQRAYTQTTYESSPIGRPTFVREPGWDGHGITYRYGVERPDVLLPNSGCQGSGDRRWCARPEGPAPAMAYVESEDADGRVTRTYTDGLGRERFVRAGILDSQNTAEDVETLTEMLYDAADRLVEVRHPLFFRPRSTESDSERQQHVTTYDYNTRGHLLATTSPDAGTTRMKYDEMGQLRYRQDSDLASRSSQTSGGYWRTYAQAYHYDALGRLQAEILGQTRCSWDQLGVTNPCAPFSGAYDDWELGGEWVVRRHVYDTNGGITSWPHYVPDTFQRTNPRGNLVASTYFSRGVHETGGARYTEAYAYDAEGRIDVKRTDTPNAAQAVATFDYNYDRVGLLRDVTIEVGPHAFRQSTSYRPIGLPYRTYVGTGSSGTTVPTSSESFLRYDAAGALEYTYFYGVGG